MATVIGTYMEVRRSRSGNTRQWRGNGGYITGQLMSRGYWFFGEAAALDRNLTDCRPGQSRLTWCYPRDTPQQSGVSLQVVTPAGIAPFAAPLTRVPGVEYGKNPGSGVSALTPDQLAYRKMVGLC
jgi:hypothetical protein